MHRKHDSQKGIFFFQKESRPLLSFSGLLNGQRAGCAHPLPDIAGKVDLSSLQGAGFGYTIDRIKKGDITLEKDILTLILAEMNRGEQRISGEIYLDGLTNVLSEPEFLESGDARNAIRLFEERSLLKDLLARAMPNGVGGVQVLIGGEGKWEELRQCSVVLSRYGIPGQVTGMLGVFGPMRMAYSRTIPTVRFMADLLSGLVSETISGEEYEQ